MADFVLGNLNNWINGLTADAINHLEPEATGTLISSHNGGPQTCVTCTALKPTISSSTGIGLCFLSSETSGRASTFISISRIADDSLFAGSGIAVGMQVASINNQIPSSPSEAAHLIRTAPRIVTIVAHKPAPVIRGVAESLVAATVELNGKADELLLDISFTAMPLSECIYVSRLSPHSPFFIYTCLRTGMIVYSINNKRVMSVAAAMEAIRLSQSLVTILAESMTLETSECSDLFPLAEVIISDVADEGGAVAAVRAANNGNTNHVLPATALSMAGSEANDDSPSSISSDGSGVEEWHEAVESAPSGDDRPFRARTFQQDTSTYIEL